MLSGSSSPSAVLDARPGVPRRWMPHVVIGLAFVGLFLQPFRLLLADWWTMPEAGHGLLLAPLAVWLAWHARHGVTLTPEPRLGTAVLVAAVLLRYVSGLAAELFTMRFSMIMGLAGIALYFMGRRRLLAWWLPFTLLALSIPLPEVALNSIALPLQFQASRIGAGLLALRHVPVQLQGNVIQLPRHQLFVTEACSGLRSLTALLSLGILAGGLWLKSPISRGVLVLTTLPVAVALNSVRVFLTGFLVFFVDPKFGEGFMHLTEGWLMFLVAFGLLGGTAWVIGLVERQVSRARSP